MAWYLCRENLVCRNVSRTNIRCATVAYSVTRNCPFCCYMIQKVQLSWEQSRMQRVGMFLNCTLCSILHSACWVCTPRYRERLNSTQLTSSPHRQQTPCPGNTLHLLSQISPSPPIANSPSHNNFKCPTISVQYLCHFPNFSFFSNTSTVPVLLLPIFLQYFTFILILDSCRLQSYGLDGTGIESHYGQEIFSSRKPSGPILIPSSLVFIGYRRFFRGGRAAGA